MWSKVVKHLADHPERLAVAKKLIENGLNIKNGKIYLNEIEIPFIGIARAANVDRRTVVRTIRDIESNPELRVLFRNLRSAGHSLREVARHIGLGVIEITPTDAKIPGILAGAATILSKRGISIRQALVDDPELSPEPRLTLIAEREIPGEVISEVLKIKGVLKVSVY